MARASLRSLAIAMIAVAGVILPQAHAGPLSDVRPQAAAAQAREVHAPAVAPSPKEAALTLAPPTTPLEQAWQRWTNAPQLVHSSISAYAYDITAHQLLAAINPTVRLTPGSVTKLFTSAAALATLGPQFTYATRVLVPPSVLAGKPGPIYLVGGGDPWLEANGRNDLELLAETVAKKIPEATQVIGVSPAYAPPSYGLGWPQGWISDNFGAATSALMAERSEVGVWVAGATTPGQSPTVSLKFNGPIQDPGYFTIVNQATTGGPGGANTIRVTRRLGTNQLVVTGSVAAQSSAGPWVISAGNPALFAASLFQIALSHDGVRFSTSPGAAASAPGQAISIATHISPSLAYELRFQNQFSINQMAENLYRAIGTGSLNSSAAIMGAFANSAGVSPRRTQVDGSGLSPLDQMSAEDVVNLLTYAAHQSWFPTFRNSLIQLDNPNACGFLCPPAWSYALPPGTAVWVKTGNLDNQWNLAGYVQTQNGQLIAFAILDDGTPTAANAKHNSPVDQMVSAVADWPNVPLPNFSPRGAISSGTMPTAVHEALAGVPLSPNLNVGISVMDASTGQIIYQRNGDVLVRAGLAPRVTLDAAALQNLPQALPGVKVLATGPVTGGILNGSLVIDSQNADLTTRDVQSLAAQVAGRGIQSVSGSVEYVNSRSGFHQSRWPYSMPWNDFGKGWAPPSAPLMVNRDQATLSITAGNSGSPANISLTPGDVPIAIQNDTKTVSSGSPTVSVRLEFQSNTFVVSGSVPEGYRTSVKIAPPDPGLYAATVFEDALNQDNVAVSGVPTALQRAPGGSVVGSLPGTPVAHVVNQSLRLSSTAPSSQLERGLGSALGADLRAWAPPPADVPDFTGAGLQNYLTPDGLGRTLVQIYHNPSEASLVRLLSKQLWTAASPEQEEMVGYVQGPHHTVDAVVVLISGFGWNGHFTPTVGPAN